MEPITFILAMVIAFVSAILGGMVGGSFLILIPALLFLGLDIHYVIGVSKLLIVAAGLASINYIRAGKVDLAAYADTSRTILGVCVEDAPYGQPINVLLSGFESAVGVVREKLFVSKPVCVEFNFILTTPDEEL